MDELTRLFDAVDKERASAPRNGRRLWAHQRCKIFASRIAHYMDMDQPQHANVLLDFADAVILDDDGEHRQRKRVSGDFILNDIITTINTFKNGDKPFILRLDQQMMVAHILTSCLPMIYGPELENRKENVLRRLGTSKIHEIMLIMASRRVGKTTCIACVTAALMICKPEFTMTIFAHIKAAAERVMGEVVKFIMMNERGREMYKNALVKNVGKIVFEDPLTKTQSRIDMYSSKSNVRYLRFPLYLRLISVSENKKKKGTSPQYDVLYA